VSNHQQRISQIRTKFIATLLFSFGLLCFTAFGQESRGEIDGTVLDPSGAVIAGANVQATNAATGTTASAKTDKDGIYAIPYLLPGSYAVSAEMTGFKKLQRTGIEVRVGDKLNLPLHLDVGNAAETIEVNSTPPVIETNQVSLGQVVDKKRIDDLPLQAGNAEELVLIAPGVVNTTNLRACKTSFNSASSQFSTNGNALYSNETTLDGIPDTFASPSNSSNGPSTNPLVAFQPPQAAVSEFKVQTSGFDASLVTLPAR
jgi:Carboxypeptidase regulatory-like domain